MHRSKKTAALTVGKQVVQIERERRAAQPAQGPEVDGDGRDGDGVEEVLAEHDVALKERALGGFGVVPEVSTLVQFNSKCDSPAGRKAYRMATKPSREIISGSPLQMNYLGYVGTPITLVPRLLGTQGMASPPADR